MLDATFICPGPTKFSRLDELGHEVLGQRLEPDRAVLACRVVEPDQSCQRRVCEVTPPDTVVRRLAHEPLGWRPTTLLVTLRRYRRTGCEHGCWQNATKATEQWAKLSRRGLRRALGDIESCPQISTGASQALGCETSRPGIFRPHVSAAQHVSHPCALSVPLESDTQRGLRDRWGWTWGS